MKNFYKITSNLRIDILDSIFLAKSGHPGGCLSCVDLIYYIFKNKLNYKKNFFRKLDRNYFVLSKGHFSMLCVEQIKKKKCYLYEKSIV